MHALQWAAIVMPGCLTYPGMQGYVRLTSYGLPSVVVVDTTLTARPGALVLLDAGLGSISSLGGGSTHSSSTQAPVIIAPFHTLQIDQLALTDVISYTPYLVNTSQTLTTWLPIFSLQRNATLLISNSIIYINPQDNREARHQHGLCVQHTTRQLSFTQVANACRPLAQGVKCQPCRPWSRA